MEKMSFPISNPGINGKRKHIILWKQAGNVVRRKKFDKHTEEDYNKYNNAGWSSLEARRAHNPKVAGSNPAPAISEKTGSVIGTGFFSFVEIEARAWYNSRRQGTPEKEIQQKAKGE